MITANERAAFSGIGFYRTTAAERFSDGEARLLQMLAPHLRRAVQLHLRFARDAAVRDLLPDAFDQLDRGVFLSMPARMFSSPIGQLNASLAAMDCASSRVS